MECNSVDDASTPYLLDAARRIDECRALTHEFIIADEVLVIENKTIEFMNRGAVWFVVGMLGIGGLISLYHFFAGTEMSLRADLSFRAAFVFGAAYFVIAKNAAERRADDAAARGRLLRQRWELSAHARLERKYIVILPKNNRGFE